MDELSNKQQQRLGWIVAYGLHQILPPLGQFLISYFVIHFNSEAAWGEVVNYLIFVNISILFFNWGQNTYLLRAFSQDAQKIAIVWQESLASRLILLLLAQVVGLYFFYDNCWNSIALFLWLLGTFVVRSFDPLHIYTRKLKGALSIEGLGFLMILFVLLLNRATLNLSLILGLYAFLAVIKAIAYGLFYRGLVFENWQGRFSKAFLIAAFPFFIPAMIGFIQSRIDLYGVAYHLSKDTLGAYQVFFKVLSLFILGNRIIISPFLKNIYRMPDKALQRMNRLMLGIGILGTAPIIGLFYYLLPLVYGIHFSVWMYVMGYLTIVPFFGYAIQTHQMIKMNREKQLVWVFLGAAMVNLCCNYCLIPKYGALGAITSTAIVQWLLFFVFGRLIGYYQTQAKTQKLGS
jgi:O-antigen/teichoic acid export membrane protein